MQNSRSCLSPVDSESDSNKLPAVATGPSATFWVASVRTSVFLNPAGSQCSPGELLKNTYCWAQPQTFWIRISRKETFIRQPRWILGAGKNEKHWGIHFECLAVTSAATSYPVWTWCLADGNPLLSPLGLFLYSLFFPPVSLLPNAPSLASGRGFCLFLPFLYIVILQRTSETLKIPILCTDRKIR